MANPAPIRFQYEPETTIRETEQMVPLDEYAHRRLTDLILLCRNQLPDNDADLARMTRTGADWPAVKARLIDEHGAFYVSEDGYLRNGRCDEILAGVERSIEQKRQAGLASAAKRQAQKDAAMPQPPVSAETTPRQVLPGPPTTDVAPPCPEPPAIDVETGPPDDAAPEPAPIITAPTVNGNGTGDGSTELGVTFPISGEGTIREPEQEGTTIPQDWQPSTESIAFAAARGYTPPEIERLARTFVQRHDQRSDKSTDWDATFRMWVLRDLASNPRPAVADHQPTPTV